MRIIFVRHGQDKNDKLTKLGIKQAKMIVNDLIYEKIAKIYSSPLERTQKTAKIISKYLKISEITLDNRLLERETINDTMTENEINEFKINYLNASFSRKNPEGLKEYMQRTFDFLDEIIQNNINDENILIIGHSSLSYILGAYFYGLPKDNILIWTRVGNCSKLCFEYNKKQY